jgi:primosomal protein N' (replication factor Y)
MELPKICPNCNAGYIKFRGMGIEKIESELSRTFPQAKIKIAQTGEKELEGADILLATSRILKHPELNFDLIGVLGIDNILSRVDFRASEKAFGLLVYLWSMTDKKLVIQTSFPAYQVFSALQKKESNFFYEEELKQRRQLGFPPYRHLILVKVRGRLEDKVRSLALTLFERLSQANKPKAIKVISLNKAQPPKLRGNFYWQILLSTASTRKASLFLKKQLRNFKHSGIIVTVDVDPL